MSNSQQSMAPLPKWLLAVHWVIIVNLAIQVLYGAYMVFIVFRPDGVTGPLATAALNIPHELMMTRRAYAAETWQAIVGLSLYVGVTEVLPRRLKLRA